MARTLLYAPNVHTGGGLVLLQGLLNTWPEGAGKVAFLDARAQAALPVPAGTQTAWFHATLASRWAAERALLSACRSDDTVLCFHGLPPLFKLPGQVWVFQQNRNLLGLNPLSQFSTRTAARLLVERLLSRLCRSRVSGYLVQTPTMARALREWFGPGCPTVQVAPFIDHWPDPQSRRDKVWDFVYVADGEAMKNHGRLFAAWALLAEQGLKPRLAVTLGPRDAALAQRVEFERSRNGLQIFNLGHLSRADVLALYGQARALVFPSISESFGLPLVEAAHLALPIVAAELDYVRDVCTPVQTFDALSAVSIARAVRRFLAEDECALEVTEPAAFWQVVLATAPPSAPSPAAAL